MLEPVAQSQVLNYIKGLNKKGLRFYLVSFEKRRYLSNLDYLCEMDNELKEEDIVWFRMRYHSIPKLLSTFYDVIAGILFCTFLIWKNKIDIIHARSEVSAAIAFVISRIFRIKFIYDRRGIMAYDYIEGGMWPRNNAITRIIFALVNALDKRFLLFSDYTVVLTHRIAEILRNDFLPRKKKLKIKVIPCCVDLNRFQYRKKDVASFSDLALSNKFILLYIGSLGSWYMLREMVDFFLEMKRYKQNAHLLVITLSDHNFAESIFRKKNLNMDDYTIIGKKFEDMPDYIASADVAIMFIMPVFSKIASCPTKFGEYLACGLPVVINSKIGDTQDIIQKNKIGVVINDFSVEEYDRKVKELLYLIEKDRGLRRRCRDVAKQYFSLNYGIESYLEVYQSLTCDNKFRSN